MRTAKAAAAILGLWVLASCASNPKPVSFYKELPDVFAPLAPGASAYLYIDVPAARPILELADFGAISGLATKDALDMTETAAAALYPKGTARRYMAVAQGKFPSFRSALSFTFSSSWKKNKSETGNAYWHSDAFGVSMALNKNTAYVSDGDPFIVPPGFESPQRLRELQAGSAMAGLVEDAADPINSFFSALGISLKFPAERIFFGLYGDPGNTGSSGFDLYSGLFYVETPTPSQARAFQSIFSLARAFLGSAAAWEDDPAAEAMAALFTHPPELDGSSLIIRTGPMTAEGMALLFSMFSVYSE
ncbi:hypothetical protein [Breznakiella homolactica]|uniref:Uncharacterized protein n=1 Tax=Breznakiella homolactica TaxID=2798577 RepID=A0A7T7XL21_9SPIR|nr:hypothetical protein [Breznakiella homolactica]QQO08369.1 hypothetical protein JFL75_15730 [Breznakiella homolactica]